MAQAVNGRRVDPVDANFQCSMNRRNRLGIVLPTPPKLPIAANGPGTKANGGDGQIRITEQFCFHIKIPFVQLLLFC
jgi:hypothetical protein